MGWGLPPRLKHRARSTAGPRFTSVQRTRIHPLSRLRRQALPLHLPLVGCGGGRRHVQGGACLSLPTATGLFACVFFGGDPKMQWLRGSFWVRCDTGLVGTRTWLGCGDPCGWCSQECRVWSLHEPRPRLWTCCGGQPLGLPLGLLAGAALGQPARGRTHQVGVWHRAAGPSGPHLGTAPSTWA